MTAHLRFSWQQVVGGPHAAVKGVREHQQSCFADVPETADRDKAVSYSLMPSLLTRSMNARISSARHTVVRGPSLMGLG